jgi:hypothetical protein
MNVRTLNIFTNGRSGSTVMLADIDNKIGVLKTEITHVDKVLNLHRQLPFDKPEIYWSTDSSMFMEYIPGISIKQYLKIANKSDLDKLIAYICSYIDHCLANSAYKDYQQLLLQRLSTFSDPAIDLCKFNTVLPSSVIHGDFTFDNLLYYDNRFYMIDMHATEFDSISFDVNKLRQDLSGGWFVRDESDPLPWTMSCNYIYRQLDQQYPKLFNDELYKFMLLRVLPYCKLETDRTFISAEIEKLCK